MLHVIMSILVYTSIWYQGLKIFSWSCLKKWGLLVRVWIGIIFFQVHFYRVWNLLCFFWLGYFLLFFLLNRIILHLNIMISDYIDDPGAKPSRRLRHLNQMLWMKLLKVDSFSDRLKIVS